MKKIDAEAKALIKEMYLKRVKTAEIAKKLTALGYVTETGGKIYTSIISKIARELGLAPRRIVRKKGQQEMKLQDGFTEDVNSILNSNLPEATKKRLVLAVART